MGGQHRRPPRNEVPPPPTPPAAPHACWAHATFRSSTTIRHDTPFDGQVMHDQRQPTAIGRPHRAQHHPRSRIRNPDRAATTASDRRAPPRGRADRRRSPHPGSGTCSAQPPAPSSPTRTRSIACRSSTPAPGSSTSDSPTPTGACNTTVLIELTSRTRHRLQPPHDRSPLHRAPPSSPTRHRPRRTPPPAPTGPRSARRTRPADDTTPPAARARATTCIDKMLSPPSLEERIVHPDPIHPQHLRQTPPPRSPGPHRPERDSPRPVGGAGRARTSQLSADRQRQRLDHHHRRRHHAPLGLRAPNADRSAAGSAPPDGIRRRNPPVPCDRAGLRGRSPRPDSEPYPVPTAPARISPSPRRAYPRILTCSSARPTYCSCPSAPQHTRSPGPRSIRCPDPPNGHATNRDPVNPARRTRPSPTPRPATYNSPTTPVGTGRNHASSTNNAPPTQPATASAPHPTPPPAARSSTRNGPLGRTVGVDHHAPGRAPAHTHLGRARLSADEQRGRLQTLR